MPSLWGHHLSLLNNMNLEKIISLDEIKSIFYNSVGVSSNKNINMGDVDGFSLEDGLVECMSLWTKRMDYYLHIIISLEKDRYSANYRNVFYERGITYQEYFSLFDTDIEEIDFHHYPVFEFLQIQSNAQRREYTKRCENNEASYIKLLQAADLRIVAIFNNCIKALLPLNGLQENLFLIGASGVGKSELLKKMVFWLSHIPNSSVILLDPHGKLVEELKLLNLGDPEKLVYINPYFHPDKTPTLNPLQISETTIKAVDTTCQYIVRVFEELLRDSILTDQMRAILTPCISTLLRKGNTSLNELMRFMDDKRNKDLVELGKTSPVNAHKQLFENRFYEQRYNSTKVSIYTRLLNLLNSPTFDRLISGESTLDLESAIEEGKVILFNLAEGEMGEDASRTFGKFIISTVQSIAKRREIRGNENKTPVYLIVDEFYHYINSSILSVVKETRKFGVHLVVANQSVGDLTDVQFRNNLFDNTAVKIVGRTGHTSVSTLSQEIGVPVENLQSLPNYSFYMKVREKPAYQFQSSDILIRDKKYWRSPEDIKKLDQMQLDKYYKPIDQPTEQNMKEVEEKVASTSEFLETNAPKPKLQL